MSESSSIEMWKTFALAIPAVCSLLMPVVIAVAGMIGFRKAEYIAKTFDEKQKIRSEEAAARVDEVKTALVSSTEHGERNLDVVKNTLEVNTASSNRKLDTLVEVTHATHTLVNANMGVQLRLNQTVTRRLADLTHDPEDERAAELAAQMYQEHQEKQAVVDNQAEANEAMNKVNF